MRRRKLHKHKPEIQTQASSCSVRSNARSSVFSASLLVAMPVCSIRSSRAIQSGRYLENYGLGTVGCAAAHLRALWTAASAWHARKPLATWRRHGEGKQVTMSCRISRSQADESWSPAGLDARLRVGKLIPEMNGKHWEG